MPAADTNLGKNRGPRTLFDGGGLNGAGKHLSAPKLARLFLLLQFFSVKKEKKKKQGH